MWALNVFWLIAVKCKISVVSNAENTEKSISVDCNTVSSDTIGFRACFRYGVDEGPCVFDDECKDDLFCGYKNCPVTFKNDDANCCGRNQFKSPNYPNDYFSDEEETWLIKAPVALIIKLQFQSFEVRLPYLPGG